MTSGHKPKKKKQSRSADYPKTATCKRKYDAFCMAYHSNGNVGSEAAIKAGYSAKTARQQAAKLLTIPYIAEKIEILQQEVKKEYIITVEQRLKWLEDIVKEAMTPYIDANDNKRPLALSDARGAIAEMNKMLGTTNSNDEESPSYEVTFSVNPAKKEIQVTNAG